MVPVMFMVLYVGLYFDFNAGQNCIIQYSNHEYPYLEPRERQNTVLSVSRNVEESWYGNCKINKKYSMTVGSK